MPLSCDFCSSLTYIVACHLTVQSTPKIGETVSVANNACWAIGELAVKVCRLSVEFFI